MKKFDSINVIPFIDIVLVLLVIVLVSASFSKKSNINIALPKSGTKSTKTEIKKEYTITIKSTGKIYINNSIVNDSELQNKILKIDTKDSIVLRSDKDAPFKYFVKIIDILKSKDYKNFYIETIKK